MVVKSLCPGLIRVDMPIGKAIFQGYGCTTKAAYRNACQKQRLGFCTEVEKHLPMNLIFDPPDPEYPLLLEAKKRAARVYEDVPTHLASFAPEEEDPIDNRPWWKCDEDEDRMKRMYRCH